MVPYHIVKHQAHSSEENLYKKCLANKFPNIKHEDYLICTKDVYAQRVEMMMNYYANTAEKLLADIHWRDHMSLSIDDILQLYLILH